MANERRLEHKNKGVGLLYNILPTMYNSNYKIKSFTTDR